MSDKDKVAVLLSELGIEFEVDTIERMGSDWNLSHPNARWAIRCVEGMNRVEGYCGFITEFYFDADGKFISMGIWE